MKTEDEKYSHFLERNQYFHVYNRASEETLYILCVNEQISNAVVFNFKYISSDINYQAYFSYLSGWGYEVSFR